ncbi:MAG: hypothetical protein AAF670_13505 [Planctomycetota bacterium]
MSSNSIDRKCWVILALAVVCGPAFAAPMSFLPVSESHIVDSDGNGTFESIFDDPAFALSIVRFDSTLEDRTVIEYDLSSIPAGSVVSGARLDFRITAAPLAGSGEVSIGGYAGNGTIELTDATNPVQPLGSYDAMALGLGATTVNLDPSFFETQLLSTDLIGLRLQAAVDQVNTSISQSTPAPTLVLDVSAIPEPTPIGFGIILLMFRCAGRRRSSTAIGGTAADAR